MRSRKEFRFSPEEWHLLHSALIQVTHGPRIRYWAAAVGIQTEDLKLFLNRLGDLNRDTELELRARWVHVCRDGLREALQQLSYLDFCTRTGYSIEEAQTCLARLNGLLGDTRPLAESASFVSGWLAGLSMGERIRQLALLSAELAAQTRAHRLTAAASKDRATIVKKLFGVNELQNKIAHQIAGYCRSESRAYPVEAFGKLLFEIATQYDAVELLESALEPARPKKGGNLRAFKRVERTGE